MATRLSKLEMSAKKSQLRLSKARANDARIRLREHDESLEAIKTKLESLSAKRAEILPVRDAIHKEWCDICSEIAVLEQAICAQNTPSVSAEAAN